MSNIFNNFLESMTGGGGNVRDFQHASRLYVDGNYELLPKSGWLYYVVLKINPKVKMPDPTVRGEFETWRNKYAGFVGVLAKSVSLPKFSVETETLNQYNRAVVIQKKIKYTPVDITFHDDGSNATTNLWKFYYQYYFADSINDSTTRNIPEILPKYKDRKYEVYTEDQSTTRYGLNNLQDVPFFTSIDIYQLHQHKFTSFRLVNPIVKSWDHGTMDQTQGNALVTSKMSLEFETVLYNTSAANKSTKDNPGFAKTKYDASPSPISVGGVGSNSILGPLGVLAGADSVLGDLANAGNLSPLELLNTGLKAASLAKNIKNVNAASITSEGYSLLNSTLGNMASDPNGVRANGVGASFASGLKQAVSPAGINLSMNSVSNAIGGVTAVVKKLGGGAGG